jgi:hypothetical protein
MSVRDSLAVVLASPSADALWRLRADLLEAGLPSESAAWPLVFDFHDFLDRLATDTSSRDYSQLASKLDISAISGVIVERLAERGDESDRALRLLAGIVSEGLMALATRQHVKAWAGEIDAVYRSAAWDLYGHLWHWSEARTPDLPVIERRRLLDQLIEPARSKQTSNIQKAMLIGRLYQVLLLSSLTEDLPDLDLSRSTGDDDHAV